MSVMTDMNWRVNPPGVARPAVSGRGLHQTVNQLTVASPVNRATEKPYMLALFSDLLCDTSVTKVTRLVETKSASVKPVANTPDLCQRAILWIAAV